MKRNDDLLRGLLMEFEEADDWQVPFSLTIDMSKELRERHGHLLLLCDDGLVSHYGKSTYRLTSSGHDYLAAIRDDTVWKRTKDGAAKVGGLTLGMMKDLAVAYLKQEVSDRLGVDL